MVLSAQDVHNKQFKLVRQSTGYDIDEVDAFLDEVETALTTLQDRLDAARHGAQAAEGSAGGPAATAPSVEATTSAATRLLELAQRTADDYVADAQRAAERIRAEVGGLEGRVTELRTYEAELRNRLRGYLTSELEQLRSAFGEAGSAGRADDASAEADGYAPEQGE